MLITKLLTAKEYRKRSGQASASSALRKVYIDDEYAFSLYERDLESFGLEEGRELSPELYQELLWELVYPRAKQKALALLKHHDRTVAELSKRLAEEGYPEHIILKTLQYLADYHYLDDQRYASSYIRSKIACKSRLFLTAELTAKGISKDVIQKVFSEEYEEQEEDPELTALRKAIQKKNPNHTDLDRKEKQKLMASLYRKGFSEENIRKVLEEYQSRSFHSEDIFL